MDLMETRLLGYFVAVAEELHFGRAAERLGIAQPPLSRAIQQLERRLGVTLFERTSRQVVLTAAGEVLLRDGGRALDALAAATRRTQRAGRTTPALVLAMKAGTDAGLLAPTLRAFRAEPESVPVEIVHSTDERVAMLHDGRADAALLHLPCNDIAGLDTEELLVERQLAVVRPGHRLAARESVLLAELEHECLPRRPAPVVPDGPEGLGGPDGPDGLPSNPGPEGPHGPDGRMVRDLGLLMHYVSTGQGVALLPESAIGLIPRALVCVPVRDAPPITMVLAWPRHSRSRSLAALVRVAASVAAARAAGVPDAQPEVAGAGTP